MQVNYGRKLPSATKAACMSAGAAQLNAVRIVLVCRLRRPEKSRRFFKTIFGEPSASFRCDPKCFGGPPAKAERAGGLLILPN
jgi:hypothetical protein